MLSIETVVSGPVVSDDNIAPVTIGLITPYPAHLDLSHSLRHESVYAEIFLRHSLLLFKRRGTLASLGNHHSPLSLSLSVERGKRREGRREQPWWRPVLGGEITFHDVHSCNHATLPDSHTGTHIHTHT